MEPFLLGGHMIRSVGDEKTSLGRAARQVRAVSTSPVAEAVGSALRSTT
jgi:hypothetical protein